jgi:PIN domain nuclease of toxin-antitoxin system
MRLLLDTHTFLWWDAEPAKLSPRVIALCKAPDTQLFVSVVSVWEIQIKSGLGKLNTRRPLRELLHEQVSINGLQLLPVTLEHVLALDRLPLHHKDPFDRLLLAQSVVENLVLASVDRIFASYPVTIVW